MVECPHTEHLDDVEMFQRFAGGHFDVLVPFKVVLDN